MPHYGFNFLWMFIWQPGKPPVATDTKALDWIAEQGFNFVRLPTDYRHWITNFEYFAPDESVFEHIDGYLADCRARDLHMSLNIHRGPGYCINRNDLERHNLWQDEIAQDAFVFQWETFARRYRGIPSSELSFDLLNEPPNEGQYGFTREIHAALMRRAVAAIRTIDPEREIVLDGVGGGHYAIPELADLDVVHSGRGYQPMPVSHYKANWWSGSAGLPEPVYPGTPWQDKTWDIDTIRELYAPWREVEAQGRRIHIGEFGCHSFTPNDVALRWFEDLFTLYREFGWGYALWNFEGPFGIIAHHRPGTTYESIKGYQVDRALLDLVRPHL